MDVFLRGARRVPAELWDPVRGKRIRRRGRGARHRRDPAGTRAGIIPAFMQALAVFATVLGIAADGNRIEFKLDHGSGELVWVTPSAFRFRRVLDGTLTP